MVAVAASIIRGVWTPALPLQEVEADCLLQCGRERSPKSGCSRALEGLGPDQAGQMTDLRCPGTHSRRQRPQQP